MKLNEYIRTKEFELGTAGYIKESSSNIQLLYHATTLTKAIKILRDNELKPFAKNYYNVVVSKKPSISFTRDLNSAKNMLLGDHPVIFVLDKEKLQNNYKFIPISDDKNNYLGPKTARYENDSKAEEICETPIKNINKYIIKILCAPSDVDAFRNFDNLPHEIFANINENYKSKLTEDLLLEMNRNQLIQKSKSSDNYKDTSKGRNRWERRNRSKIATRVDQYNKIDMNDFFKNDILKVGINVHGETDDYIVTIRYNGVLREIQNQIRLNNNKLEFKCVFIALQKVFNSGNVFVSCNCLHPDTKIKLLDGTTRTIEQMKLDFDSGKKLWVYSVDENGDFKPGEVENIWVSGEATEFIKIILDNDEEILTTPEHLYMLRDSTYIEAQDLKENDSLMPLYFNEKNGYETVKSNTTYRYKSVYKEVAKALKMDEIEEAKKRVQPDDNMNYDVAIHHRDFNKKNNNPDNLQVMTAKEHWTYHANLCGPNRPITKKMKEVSRQNAYKRNANPTPAMIESRKKFQEKGRLRNYDEDRKKQQSEIWKKTIASRPDLYSSEARSERNKKVYAEHPEYREKISQKQKEKWASYTPEEYARRCQINRENNEKSKELRSQRVKEAHSKYSLEKKLAIAEKCRQKLKGRKKGPDSEETRLKKKLAALNMSKEAKEARNLKCQYTKIKHTLEYMLSLNIPLTLDNYKIYVHNRAIQNKGYTGVPLEKYFHSIEEAVAYFKLNHKVKKVERIVLPNTSVYDISVKNYANFLVEAGVILHNCKDRKYRQAYNATRGGYNSGEPEIRVSDITNPHDSKGAGCKHVNLVLGNIDWIMKIASVINNYIHYMKDHYERKYADLIFPKLFGITYNKAVQLNLFDTDDDLKDNPDEIKLSNTYGRERTRFRKDVQVNNMKNFGKEKEIPDNPNQVKLELGLTKKISDKHE